MIKLICLAIMIVIFFLLGYFVQAFKKLFSLITNIFLTLFNFLGIKIKLKEKTLVLSKEFYETYKDIKVVKIANQNLKTKSSIDWIFLSIFIIALILLIVNLEVVSQNIITNWLFSITPKKLIGTYYEINTIYVAVLFSVLTFSLGKIATRWKETKQQRKEKKDIKLKLKALALMDSKELLDEAKKKDLNNYNELK